MLTSLLSRAFGSRSGEAAPQIDIVALLVVGSALVMATPGNAATMSQKTFGGWTVSCVEPDKAAKRCSMVQSQVQVDKQTNRKSLALRWTISTDEKHEQTLGFMVPTGVSIKEGVRFFLGDADPIVVAYTFCGPRICFASIPLDAKTIAATKASKKASASAVLGSKQLMQVQLDLSGFGEAYDYLVQQLS